MFSFNGKKSENEVTLTVNNRTVIRVLILVILSIFALAAIRQAAHALVLIGTAFFLALALNAPVHWVEERLPGRRRGDRSLATILAALFVLLLLVGFFASIVPPLMRQVGSLIDAIPSFVSDLRNPSTDVGRFVDRYNLEEQVNSFSGELSERLKNASSEAVSVIARVGTSTFSVLTILVLTFMMLLEGPRWMKIFEQLTPEHRRTHTKRLSMAMYKVIKGYVNGQVLLAAIAAVLIVPMFFILDISYPLALMAVVFIAGLIPMVGHTIGALIVTAVALFTSPVAALIIFAYYILYQQIENYLVQPRIQANTTNMSPLLVFTAVVLGVNFGGLLGGLVAIPLMGCFRILVLDQLESRQLLKAKVAYASSPKADTK